MKAFLSVKQKVSTIGRDERQEKIVRGLGLRGPGSSVVVANTPSFRGMVKKVLHLVEVAEVDAAPAKKSAGSPPANTKSAGSPPANKK